MAANDGIRPAGLYMKAATQKSNALDFSTLRQLYGPKSDGQLLVSSDSNEWYTPNQLNRLPESPPKRRSLMDPTNGPTEVIGLQRFPPDRDFLFLVPETTVEPYPLTF